jgi:hypothetical protein
MVKVAKDTPPPTDRCPHCTNPFCWQAPKGWVCQLPPIITEEWKKSQRAANVTRGAEEEKPPQIAEISDEVREQEQ